jgi:hypothetical protein
MWIQRVMGTADTRQNTSKPLRKLIRSARPAILRSSGNGIINFIFRNFVWIQRVMGTADTRQNTGKPLRKLLTKSGLKKNPEMIWTDIREAFWNMKLSY